MKGGSGIERFSGKRLFQENQGLHRSNPSLLVPLLTFNFQFNFKPVFLFVYVALCFSPLSFQLISCIGYVGYRCYKSVWREREQKAVLKSTILTLNFTF